MELELEAPYWNGAKNLITTTIYSIAREFDALTDMEELHIQKSSDLPNNSLIHIWAPFRLNNVGDEVMKVTLVMKVCGFRKQILSV